MLHKPTFSVEIHDTKCTTFITLDPYVQRVFLMVADDPHSIVFPQKPHR